MHSLALLLVPVLALGACSRKEHKPVEQSEGLGSSTKLEADLKATPVEIKPTVIATLSIDWEGAYLSDHGLKALSTFRKEWKDAPITHFICPAYFTQGEVAGEIAASIKEHIHDGDEVGLHIHSWFQLAQHAGVSPREAPNFYADSSTLMEFPHDDRGYEVSLAAYSPDELTKIMTASAQLLIENGLGTPTSFRSGGYVSSPEILAAVRAAGMHVDSSAAWSTWFDESQGNFASELKRTWPNLQELTQPYGMDSPNGTVIEVPNTGSFPEYASTDEMLGHLQRAATLSKKNHAPVYVNFGVHQESAHEYIHLVSDALRYFHDDAPEVLTFSTVTKVADEAMGL